jgi:hypothetical protein
MFARSCRLFPFSRNSTNVPKFIRGKVGPPHKGNKSKTSGTSIMNDDCSATTTKGDSILQSNDTNSCTSKEQQGVIIVAAAAPVAAPPTALTEQDVVNSDIENDEEEDDIRTVVTNDNLGHKITSEMLINKENLNSRPHPSTFRGVCQEEPKLSGPAAVTGNGFITLNGMNCVRGFNVSDSRYRQLHSSALTNSKNSDESTSTVEYPMSIATSYEHRDPLSFAGAASFVHTAASPSPYSVSGGLSVPETLNQSYDNDRNYDMDVHSTEAAIQRGTYMAYDACASVMGHTIANSIATKYSGYPEDDMDIPQLPLKATDMTDSVVAGMDYDNDYMKTNPSSQSNDDGVRSKINQSRMLMLCLVLFLFLSVLAAVTSGVICTVGTACKPSATSSSIQSSSDSLSPTRAPITKLPSSELPGQPTNDQQLPILELPSFTPTMSKPPSTPPSLRPSILPIESPTQSPMEDTNQPTDSPHDVPTESPQEPTDRPERPTTRKPSSEPSEPPDTNNRNNPEPRTPPTPTPASSSLTSEPTLSDTSTSEPTPQPTRPTSNRNNDDTPTDDTHDDFTFTTPPRKNRF